MGGLIAYLHETSSSYFNYVDGYILSSPALKIQMSWENRIKNAMASLPLINDAVKHVSIDPGINYKDLVTDSQVLAELEEAAKANRPLIEPKITVCLGTELYRATRFKVYQQSLEFIEQILGR